MRCRSPCSRSMRMTPSAAACRWRQPPSGRLRRTVEMSVPFPAMKRPLVAILRGIKLEEAEAIVGVLIEAGMTAIEIPLNSPDPFRSIGTAAKLAPAGVLIGAGTVLATADVDRLNDVGGKLMVSPNVDTQVLTRAHQYAMVTLPGVFSPTEALLAARSGASGLKFFPASVLGASGIAAIRAVLPAGVMIAAVGGVSDQNFAEDIQGGVAASGVGSSLYKPGMRATDVAARAKLTIAAYDRAIAKD